MRAKQSDILWNGQVLKLADLPIHPGSDWMRFAPGFFESIKVRNGRLYFWEEHYKRMLRGSWYWGVNLPSSNVLRSQLESFMDAISRYSGKLRIQFGVDIAKGGVDYMAVLEEVDHIDEGYQLNDEGWKVGIYQDRLKFIGKDADHKSNRRDIYLLAEKWRLDNDFDEAIVINQFGKVADGTYTNVFWLENGKWLTPPLHTGCIPGVMRDFLLSKAADWSIDIIESDIFPNRLMTATEIVLTNVIRGIRWVRSLSLDGEMFEFEQNSAKDIFRNLAAAEKSFLD